MIVTVGNTKGGVGKTTLAVNQAIDGVRVGRLGWRTVSLWGSL